MTHNESATLDPEEVARFGRLAAEWWDANGTFRPLHKLNPARLAYIRDRLCAHFRRDPRRASPLAGLAVVDIGCGGGLVAEPLARLGARVTGIDPAAESIEAAKAHAALTGLDIDYRATTAEALAAAGASVDLVLLLEVVEHVPDVPAFVNAVTPLMKPDGLMILSTINRTLKAYALAIIGAEFVLRWVPVGTHQWQRFVKPEELTEALAGAGLKTIDIAGLIYDPLADEWRQARDTDVNYFVTARRA